jgi:hypothetical protein
MAISVMVRAILTIRGERLSVATATPAIQIATSKHKNANAQNILPDLWSLYTIYIPTPRARKLKKYRIAGQDMLHLQTNAGG